MITSCTMKERVDMIIVNGNVYTVDSSFSKCSAVAVKEGVIVATGSDEEILNSYKSSTVTDLEGASLYPGFNDAHCHLYSLGESLLTVNLRGAESFEEILSRLTQKYESSKPDFLLGEGWDQNLWKVKEFPTNAELNRLFPDVPVVLIRIDFHAVIVNQAAIDSLGISPEDGNIPTAEAIIKGGKFSGIFLEKSADRFRNAFSLSTGRKNSEDILLNAQEECFKYGLTSVSDADVSLPCLLLMDSLVSEGKLKLRVDAWMTANDENRTHFSKPYRNGRLRVGTLKLYEDGALGSRGALMLEPYSDMPGYTGIRVESRENLINWCKWAFERGFQVAVHSIGDSANRDILKIYSSVLPEGNNLRWRVEHAQVVHPDDISLFGKYSIIPSVQPTHATSDMLWADERLGERIKNAYAYKDLLGQLGWLPAGTDFPIEQVNPLNTFFAAVFRKNVDFMPVSGFQMENSLTRQEALRAMTIWAAKGSFEENVKGSIEAGKYADFVVLDKDIMTCPEEEVLKTNVMMTFLGGVPVYSR